MLIFTSLTRFPTSLWISFTPRVHHSRSKFVLFSKTIINIITLQSLNTSSITMPKDGHKKGSRARSGARPPRLSAERVVNFLRRQQHMPHPLVTGPNTVRLWLAAMNTGETTNYLRRMVPKILSLWAETGVSEPFSREQVELVRNDQGENVEPPVLSHPWVGGMSRSEVRKTKRDFHGKKGKTSSDDDNDEDGKSHTRLTYSQMLIVLHR